jgi:translation initiation factor IF-3
MLRISSLVSRTQRRYASEGPYRFARPANPITRFSRPLEDRDQRDTTESDGRVTYRPKFADREQPIARSTFRKPPPIRQYGPQDPLRPVRDENINSFRVIVRIDGVLQPPQLLADVLNTIDRNFYYLQQTAAATDESPPICVIIPKQQAHIAEQKRTAKGMKPVDRKKQIELSWVADQHDLQRRILKLEEFLNEGRKVDITIKNKKTRRPATLAECRAVVSTIVDKIAQMPGVREYGPRTGFLGQVMMIFVEGKMSAEVKERLERKEKEKSLKKGKGRGKEEEEESGEVEKMLDDL